MTLELTADAPQHDLPWIITFGPLDEDEDWEPVVCGPYERPHAMAIAQHIIADADLMAVVEPLLPATTLGEIQTEIENSKQNALEAIAEEEADDGLDTDFEFDDDDEDEEHDHEHAPAHEPSPDEIRAGFARISERLTKA